MDEKEEEASESYPDDAWNLPLPCIIAPHMTAIAAVITIAVPITVAVDRDSHLHMGSIAVERAGHSSGVAVREAPVPVAAVSIP